MKKTANILLVASVAGLTILNSAMAEGNSTPSESVTFDASFLDLSGVMTDNGEKIADYSVYVFQDGTPTDTFQVSTRLEQHYILFMGHNYALKFSKPGFKDRILLVSTNVASKLKHDIYTFRYSIEFIKEGESNTFDDFPVALIHFDEKKKDFDYNRTYQQNVRTDNQPSEQQTASKSWN